jgi:hypothetical protein
VLVAPGAQSGFWSLGAKPVAAPQAIGSGPFRYFNGGYFVDTVNAAWVSPQADGNAGPLGLYTYDLVIFLNGLDPATASISGVFGTDNAGSISLNGNAPVAATGSGDFSTPTAFTINSGFVAGLNTIRVQVNNEGDPTAFFVSFTSATADAIAVPAPVPAISLPALALLALVLLIVAAGTLLARNRRYIQ